MVRLASEGASMTKEDEDGTSIASHNCKKLPHRISTFTPWTGCKSQHYMGRLLKNGTIQRGSKQSQIFLKTFGEEWNEIPCFSFHSSPKANRGEWFGNLPSRSCGVSVQGTRRHEARCQVLSANQNGLVDQKTCHQRHQRRRLHPEKGARFSLRSAPSTTEKTAPVYFPFA